MNNKVLGVLLPFIYLFFASPQVSAKINESPHAQSGVHCESRGHCSRVHTPPKPRRYRGTFSGGPLDGSFFDRKKSLAHENLVADELKLPRFQKLDDIVLAHPVLNIVPLETETFFVDEHVDPNRRYLQKWTYAYLVNLASDLKKEVPSSLDYPKLKVTSLVRDLDYQLHRVKSAAKCKEPETCSTHLTGATFDISFKNMSREQYKWMYERLSRDRDQGAINAIHEPWSGCFHIFVLPPEDSTTVAPK